MKSNAPWSVKGIERDARETAKEAARREGMTVGEWLNQIIYSHSEGAAPGALADSEVEGLKLRDIVTAIEHLRNRVVEAESKNARVFADFSRNMGGFVERVQRLERIRPETGTYEDLAGRLDRLEQASNGDRNRIEALRALEKAVAQVAVQFNNAQRTTITRLDSAEAQLQEFAERLDRVGDGQEPAEVNALKSAIDHLAERVSRAETIAGQAAALKTAAEGSADPEFVERTGAQLRVLGDEIKRGGDQIRSLEGLIQKLSAQIEAAEKRSAEGVAKVTETIADVRSQLLEDEARRDDGPDVEALLARARAQTDDKLEALERSLVEMKTRVEDLGRVAETRAEAPASEFAPAPAALAAPRAPTLAAAVASDIEDSADEIEEAVAALEADVGAETDPFGFSDEAIDDIVEDEAGAADADAAASLVQMDDDVADEFSFELDESEEDDGDISFSDASAGDAGDEAVEEAADEADPRDARALLAEVRSALTGEGLEVEDPADAAETQEINAEDDADEDAGGAALAVEDHEDDEDVQAPNTASLAAGMAIDTDASAQAGASPATPASAGPAKEDLIQAARRRAQEAQARKSEQDAADETKRPAAPALRRSQLTAKQRAILAARARQKQLAAQETETQPAPAAAEAPAPDAAVAAASVDTEEAGEDRAARIGKFASVLAAARSRLARKDEPEAPANVDADSEASPRRNQDREALQSIQTGSSVKKVTIAIGVAFLLAIAALAFIMKDMVMKPAGRRPAAPASVTQPADEAAAPAEAPEALAEVPAAPAVDPRAIYRESLAALGAAESDADASAAIGRLEEAAALGFPPAQLQLGELYKTGQGVEQDFGQARIWFRRAANGGNLLAMHRLGVMTARGDGGPADSAEAITWFERAANLGLVDSQYNLGAIYHPSSDSKSTVQSAAKAYYWYSLAARNGDAQAGSLAAGVGAALSGADRSQIDADVAAWTAEPADAEANANAAE